MERKFDHPDWEDKLDWVNVLLDDDYWNGHVRQLVSE